MEAITRIRRYIAMHLHAVNSHARVLLWHAHEEVSIDDLNTVMNGYEAKAVEVNQLSGTVAALRAKVELLTALCDGYRGEVEAAQWSTNVLAEEVKRFQSALTRARAEGME